ncbi:MAG: cytidylate kinase-like family protein [Planctomycetes bacterium]|nr:cytidylate kinase-like family protein [Planctomycetota bacterium]
MKDQTREDPKIIAAAERQMQAWSRTQQLKDQQCLHRLNEDHGRDFGPFVTLSRQAGTGGEEIARLVGERLGWEVLDKNLLDQIAENFKLSRPLLEQVDETEAGWLSGVLDGLLDPPSIPHEKYVDCLNRIVFAAGRRGNVVLVGRGARFLLPMARGLAVRILAPPKYRFAQLAKSHDLREDEVRRLMETIDGQRRKFVQQYFHHDINDPHLYDLAVNVERLGAEGAAQQIVVALGAAGLVES